jgi:hypothetical protein
MSILDNPTPLPPAASEPPANPFNGIGIPAEGAAQHLPDLPAEVAAAARTAVLPAPANDAATAAARFPNPLRTLAKNIEDGRLSPGKAGSPTAA